MNPEKNDHKVKDKMNIPFDTLFYSVFDTVLLSLQLHFPRQVKLSLLSQEINKYLRFNL